MPVNNCPQNTVVILWTKQRMKYLNQHGEIIDVQFLPHERGGMNVFELCCFVAVAQDFYSEEGMTGWTGLDEVLYNAAKNEFGWSVSYASLRSYRQRLKDGEKAGHGLTRICVNEKLPLKQRHIAHDLFVLHKGHFLLGTPEEQKDGYRKLWSTVFQDQDDAYKRFRQRSVAVLREAPAPGSLQNKYETVRAANNIGFTI